MRIGVAASGGRDSTALLHCVWRAAAALGVDVLALHVHHGLVAEADDWVAHLREQTRRWSRRGAPIRLEVTHLDNKPTRGDSVEAWARRERYAALTRMARSQGCDAVLLAHHRRDQAETVLLQALRGAGASGLAAMPRSVLREGLHWYRPWLDMPSSAIDAYVARWRLSHIEDHSNGDDRFARNRLRRMVWPALLEAFPQAELSLTQVAIRAHESRDALLALAGIDAGDAVEDGALQLAAWRALPWARRANLLRHWLLAVDLGPVPETLVQRLMQELPAARQGSWPWHTRRLRLHRGHLSIEADTAAPPSHAAATAPRDLSRPGSYRFDDWAGVLCVAPADDGLRADDLRAAVLRLRQGGERFRLQARGADRSLKKQFQAQDVPAWQRSGPLVYSGGRLLFVPGLGLDARVRRSGERGLLQLRWEPDDAQP